MFLFFWGFFGGGGGSSWSWNLVFRLMFDIKSEERQKSFWCSIPFGKQANKKKTSTVIFLYCETESMYVCTDVVQGWLRQTEKGARTPAGGVYRSDYFSTSGCGSTGSWLITWKSLTQQRSLKKKVEALILVNHVRKLSVRLPRWWDSEWD